MGDENIVLVVVIVLLAVNISRSYDGFTAPRVVGPLNEVGVLRVQLGEGLRQTLC